jgi:hypothetical protein
MRVSAVIPTYNRRTYIGRAIESILSQTLPVDELIVIDDGSTDGTSDFIGCRFGQQVRVVRQENQGVSAARRRALQEANGDWIAFLDSDDEWTRDRNRRLTEAAAAVPLDVAWIFGNIQLVEDQGDQQSTFGKFGLHLKASPEVFVDSMDVQYPFQFGMLQASLIRREALIAVDAFATSLQHSEDFLVGVQIACRYRYAAVDTVVARLYRTGDLTPTSLDSAGQHGVDYYRARMQAYSLIIQSGRRHPWGERYAHVVRGLCKLRANQGKAVGKMAFEQFRYGCSLKSLAFQCAASLGQPGLIAWRGIHKCLRGKEKRAVGFGPQVPTISRQRRLG